MSGIKFLHVRVIGVVRPVCSLLSIYRMSGIQERHLSVCILLLIVCLITLRVDVLLVVS